MVDSNTETCTSSSCYGKIYPSLNNTADASVRARLLKMLMRLDYKKINDMQKEISVERNERERTYTK